MSLTTNLLAFWDFKYSNYTNGVLSDISGNGKNLTLTGSVTNSGVATLAPIYSAVAYDDISSFKGRSNIPVSQSPNPGRTKIGRININSAGQITIVDPGEMYSGGLATIGSGTRIYITIDQSFSSLTSLTSSQNSFFTVDPAILPIIRNSTDLSIGGWHNINSSYGGHMFGGGSPSTPGIYLGIDLSYYSPNPQHPIIAGVTTTNNGSPAFYKGYGETQRLNANTAYPGWQHLFMTFSSRVGIGSYSGTVSIYLNGVLVGRNPYCHNEGTGGRLANITQSILINSSRNSFGNNSQTRTGEDKGAIYKDLGIWNRTLSDSEIFNLYYRGAGNPYPFTKPNINRTINDNLEAIWPLTAPKTGQTNQPGLYAYAASNNSSVSDLYPPYISLGRTKISPGPAGTAVRFYRESDDSIGKLDGFFNFPASAYSISFWLRLDDTPLPGVGGIYPTDIFRVIDTNDYTTKTRVRIGTGRDLYLIYGSSAQGIAYQFDLGVFPSNIFQHIVLTFDGSSATKYVNGSNGGTGFVAGSNSYYTSIDRTTYNISGGEIQVGGFGGSLTDLRIWSRAINQQEVNAIYNSTINNVQFSVSTTGDDSNQGSVQFPLKTAGTAYNVAKSLGYVIPEALAVNNTSTPGVNGNYMPNGAGIALPQGGATIGYIAVGGGGGGAIGYDTIVDVGGGGGGDVVSGSFSQIPGHQYNITVGSGGAAGERLNYDGVHFAENPSNSGKPGESSSISDIVVANGGHGGGLTPTGGKGAGGNRNPIYPNDPEAGGIGKLQGIPPGTWANPDTAYLAGLSGFVYVSSYGKHGYYFGAGGGSSVRAPYPGLEVIKYYGSYGAGNGGGIGSGIDGLANHGGGGGACRAGFGSKSKLLPIGGGWANVSAGDGGSGVVILVIPESSYSGITSGNPTVLSTNIGYKVLVFKNSGTYTASSAVTVSQESAIWYLNGDNSEKYAIMAELKTTSPNKYSWTLKNTQTGATVISSTAVEYLSVNPHLATWGDNMRVSLSHPRGKPAVNLDFAAGTYTGITINSDWNNNITLSGAGKATTKLGGITTNTAMYHPTGENGEGAPDCAAFIQSVLGDSPNISISSNKTIDFNFVDAIGGNPVGNGGNITLKNCVVTSGVNAGATPPGNYPSGIDSPVTIATSQIYHPEYTDSDDIYHEAYYENVYTTAYSPTDPRYNLPVGLSGNIILDGCETGDVYADGYGYNWYPADGGNISIINSTVKSAQSLGNNGGSPGNITVTTTPCETSGGSNNGGNNNNAAVNPGTLLLSQILNLPFSL